jgi:fucose 4-O-acetylase-like acetyltransferase
MSQFHRDQGLDCTKGIAIFAVVLFHITRGFVSSGQIEPTMALRFADTFAYGFHVPVFFLIAGYLVFPKADDAQYQLRRQSWFYYGYLLWSLVTWVLTSGFSGAVNKPMGWHELLWIPVIPIQHFWFILVLMVGTALLGLLRTSTQLIAAIGLFIAISYGLQLGLVGPAPITSTYTQSLPFILTGGWLRRSGMRLPVSLPAVLTALAGFTLAIAAATLHESLLTSATAFPIILAGCYIAYAAGTYAMRSRWLGSILLMLGQHSYAIYILHVIAGAGSRILLARFLPWLDVSLAMLVSFLAALILPIIAERIARQMGLAALAGFDPLPFWSVLPKPRSPEMPGASTMEAGREKSPVGSRSLSD